MQDNTDNPAFPIIEFLNEKIKEAEQIKEDWRENFQHPMADYFRNMAVNRIAAFKEVLEFINELHLEAIQNDKSVRKQLCVNDFGTSKLEMIVAEKSAEITENIAIEFAEWLTLNTNSTSIHGEYIYKNVRRVTKELLQLWKEQRKLQ